MFPQTQCFSGSVSCVQVFNKGLNQAEIDLKKFCPDVNKEDHVIVPCPSSYELVEGLCVKVSFTISSFLIYVVDFKLMVGNLVLNKNILFLSHLLNKRASAINHEQLNIHIDCEEICTYRGREVMPFGQVSHLLAH